MASTTADLALLGRKLGAADYNPDIYVKEIVQSCVGGHEVYQQRNNIKVWNQEKQQFLRIIHFLILDTVRRYPLTA